MKHTSSTTLIAEWAIDDDPTVDQLKSITWGDGSPATVKDYVAHLDATFTWLDDDLARPKRICYLDVIADVKYDEIAGVWAISGHGVQPASLDLTDPNALDEQIVAELYTFPTVYKPRIHRRQKKVPIDVQARNARRRVMQSTNLYWIASHQKKTDWLIYAKTMKSAAALHRDEDHCTIDSRRCFRVLQSIHLLHTVSGEPPCYAATEDLIQLGFRVLEAPAGILAVRLGHLTFVEGYQHDAVPELRDDFEQAWFGNRSGGNASKRSHIRH